MRTIAARPSAPDEYATALEAVEAVRQGDRYTRSLDTSRVISGRRILGVLADVNVVHMFLEGDAALCIEGSGRQVEWRLLQGSASRTGVTLTGWQDDQILVNATGPACSMRIMWERQQVLQRLVGLTMTEIAASNIQLWIHVMSQRGVVFGTWTELEDNVPFLFWEDDEEL